MKSWRDISAEARARGYFTIRDYSDWTIKTTCPANEICMQVAGIGWSDLTRDEDMKWIELWKIGNALGLVMARNDFDKFERLLDAIEDRAMQLKRGAAS